MSGAFGLLGGPHLSHFPADLLVDYNLRLDIWDLDDAGLLVEGASGRVRWSAKTAREGGSSPTREVEIEIRRDTPHVLIGATPVLVTWDEPIAHMSRPWWECPRCIQRTRFIYILRDTVACRHCHGLDWASRHLYRSTPGVHRIARWRRQLGADPRPFSDLPKRPARHVRYDRLAEKIRAEEAKLVDHLDGIVHDLDRRIRVRKAKGKW